MRSLGIRYTQIHLIYSGCILTFKVLLSIYTKIHSTLKVYAIPKGQAPFSAHQLSVGPPSSESLYCSLLELEKGKIRISPFASLQTWGCWCKFSDSFVTAVQLGKRLCWVRSSAVLWMLLCSRAFPGPQIFWNLEHLSVSLPYLVPSVKFGGYLFIYDSYYFFFHYLEGGSTRQLYSAGFWLLLLYVFPWLLFLFYKHGCSLRRCPLPCFLLHYLSQKCILLPCYQLSLFIVNDDLNLELWFWVILQVGWTFSLTVLVC